MSIRTRYRRLYIGAYIGLHCRVFTICPEIDHVLKGENYNSETTSFK